MRSIIRTTSTPWIFYIRDLRSGQFRDLPSAQCPWQIGKISTTFFPHQNISIHSEWFCLRSSVKTQVTASKCDLLGLPRDLDLRSNFALDLSRWYYTCFDASWRGKHDGVKVIAPSISISITSHLAFGYIITLCTKFKYNLRWEGVMHLTNCPGMPARAFAANGAPGWKLLPLGRWWSTATHSPWLNTRTGGGGAKKPTPPFFHG